MCYNHSYTPYLVHFSPINSPYCALCRPDLQSEIASNLGQNEIEIVLTK